MTIQHIEFIVEEPSMEAFLRGFLPRMLGQVSFSIHPFQGKNEMLTRLPQRLQGYARWLPETHRIVVVVDRDDDDCQQLKQRLDGFSYQAGLATRSNPIGGSFRVVNRIAIEELEAWYFGAWDAVHAAYPRVKPTATKKQRYRDPDNIMGGTWEAFERLLQAAGYFKTGLRKIEAARTIGLLVDPTKNTSHSFRVFCDALREMVST